MRQRIGRLISTGVLCPAGRRARVRAEALLLQPAMRRAVRLGRRPVQARRAERVPSTMSAMQGSDLRAVPWAVARWPGVQRGRREWRRYARRGSACPSPQLDALPWVPRAD